MADHQEKLKKDYDRIWLYHLEKDDYTELTERRRIDRKIYYTIIEKYISHFANPTVLELGCGTGIDINFITERNKFIKPFASDISGKSIQVALKVCADFRNHIRLFVADTLHLPLKDQTVHIVFSQGLIEHFKDPLAVIREQMRVLKEGGILIVNVPQKYTGYTLMKKKQMRMGKWQLGWETEFSSQDLKKIGKILGLTRKEVRGYQYWKSWKEPSFVLRDLYDKFHRRNPLKNYYPFPTLGKGCEILWERIEERLGHYFLQNIVIIFQKERA